MLIIIENRIEDREEEKLPSERGWIKGCKVLKQKLEKKRKQLCFLLCASSFASDGTTNIREDLNKNTFLRVLRFQSRSSSIKRNKSIVGSEE